MAPQDYTRRSFQAAAALIAVLVCVAFIPPQTICGIPLRRANILSDVLRFDDKEAADETLPELDDEFSGDFHRFAGQLDAGEAPLPADSIAAEPPAADTLSAAPQLAFEWTPADSEPPTEPPTGDTARLLTTLTPIEDFDTLADGPLYRFCARLADTARRTPVRIAVLGDSFIEGDILTADLREQLQLRYGGRGCGFAPMSSPLTGYRRTVGTRSAGWNSYNIMQRRTTPEALRGDYSVSGWLCRPAASTVAAWRGCSSSAESRAGWNSRSTIRCTAPSTYRRRKPSVRSSYGRRSHRSPSASYGAELDSPVTAYSSRTRRA